MGSLSINCMREYLSKVISSFNKNKLNGLLAEIDFRQHLASLGFQARVSPGGWILRRNRDDFGSRTVVIFPKVIEPGRNYVEEAFPDAPPLGLHTVCATFQQIGIHAYYCLPSVGENQNPLSVTWRAARLGVPMPEPLHPFPAFLSHSFVERDGAYNFLRHSANVDTIPDELVSSVFSKEHLRVSFSNRFFGENSDVDGIFWGENYTYPLEVKEKTVASDPDMGEWFGLDVGPFVKLAFYAAKKGNLHSLFVIREIDDIETRGLVNWWFITFETLATYASWVMRAGGAGMGGGRSAVVRIPRSRFSLVTAENLSRL